MELSATIYQLSGININQNQQYRHETNIKFTLLIKVLRE